MRASYDLIKDLLSLVRLHGPHIRASQGLTRVCKASFTKAVKSLIKKLRGDVSPEKLWFSVANGGENKTEWARRRRTRIQ